MQDSTATSVVLLQSCFQWTEVPSCGLY